MMTLIEKYLRYLRYERNYSLHTEISYSVDLQQFVDFLSVHYPKSDIKTLDGDIIRSWIVSLMEGGVSARSVNRKLSALKSLFRYLLRMGEIEVSPMKKVVGPQIKKPIPSFVNYSDMEKVLEDVNFDNTFESFRDHVILELFYVTGIRRAELIGLQDKDVELEEGAIKVTGKRNKQRIIPIGDKMKVLLKDYIVARDTEIEGLSGYLFVKKDGGQLYPMLVHRIVTGHLDGMATLSKSSPHVLRHSFATGMLNNGADINAVKELLGHSSLASTEVYTHTSFKELKEIYNGAHPRARK